MEIIGKRAARAPAAEVLATWHEYKLTGDRELRDRLVFTFMPMVRYIVYRKVREVPARCGDREAEIHLSGVRPRAVILEDLALLSERR